MKLLTFLFFVVAVLTSSTLAADKPTNVLWIYLEDVSGWFGCYGDKIIETPNINALAKSGTRFDRFYTPAGVCSATRSAVITGLMQTSFGAHHHRSCRADFRGMSMGDEYDKNVLPETIKPLPQIFKEAGYYTFNEGSGKDDFNFEWSREVFYNHVNNKWNFKGAKNGSEWTGRKEGQAFFGQIQLAGGKLGRNTPKVVDRAKVPVPPYYPDIPLVREEIGHHYDCLIETDKAVGEIVAALKRDDLYDNTLIILFSDHGYLLHRHKQYLFEGGIQMPLIVAGPGIGAGQVRKDLVSGIDIGPASLAAVGLPIPKVMEGRDFLAKDYKVRDYVIAARDRCDHTYERIRAVVTPKFKYLRNYLTDRSYVNPSYKDSWPVSKVFRQMMADGEMNEPQLVFFASEGKPAEEFYDLENDPHEIHNLANDPKFAEELKRHQDILTTWIKVTGDQGQQVESDAGLLATMKRWGDLCVNPEYDRVRDEYKAWKANQPAKKAAKKKKPK
jgi:N-sulfoglucosamine sulfohydrolase